MNLVGQMLNNLNVSCIVTTHDGKILSSSIENDEFVKSCIDCTEKEINMFVFDNKFYQCGKEEDERKIVYWAQDVSKVYEMLGKDKLTKLYNRTIAEPLIDKYILHSFETGEPFSIVMGDIDFFKKINDTYGHNKGDEALANTSKTLLNNFRTRDRYDFFNEKRCCKERDKDILCRYGGEEFLIVIKNITLENTLKKIESIREIIEEQGILTMSFGISNFDPKLYDVKIDNNNVSIERQKMIKISDICLYQSKHNGRNQLSYFDHNGDEVKSNPKTYKKGV